MKKVQQTAPVVHYLPVENTQITGFVRIITNPEPGMTYMVTAESDPLNHACQYLRSVSYGDGARAYCPFVKSIEAKNMYYAKTYSDIEQAVHELERIFFELSPGETHGHRKPDLISVVAVFDLSECGLFDEAHARFRSSFIQKGLMIATMHPEHEIGGRPGSPNADKPMFVAPLPLFVVRRMNAADSVFMKTDEDKAVFANRFGGGSASKCPFHHKNTL
jgi:hypothetical protein